LFVVGTLLCLLFLLGIVYDESLMTEGRTHAGTMGMGPSVQTADLILFQTARADMGPKVDPRSQIKKARIGWVASWMGEQDEQGDRVGDWALRVNNSTFKCRWCNKVAIACNVQFDFS
jgi:hypothetical protein